MGKLYMDDIETGESEVVEEGEPVSLSSEKDGVTVPNEAVSSLEDSILESAPREVRQALESAPPEVRRRIAEFLSSATISPDTPLVDPVTAKLVDKLDSEHLTYFLQALERDAELAYQDTQRIRLYNLILILVGSAMFTFLVRFLADTNPDLLRDLIILLVAFIGGFSGGIIYTRRRGSE